MNATVSKKTRFYNELIEIGFTDAGDKELVNKIEKDLEVKKR